MGEIRYRDRRALEQRMRLERLLESDQVLPAFCDTANLYGAKRVLHMTQCKLFEGNARRRALLYLMNECTHMRFVGHLLQFRNNRFGTRNLILDPSHVGILLPP